MASEPSNLDGWMFELIAIERDNDAVARWAQQPALDWAAAISAQVVGGIQASVASAYQFTQKILSVLGDSFVLYRGTGQRYVDAHGFPRLLPLSSWSLKRSVADRFPFSNSSSDSVVVAAEVPAERILSIPGTGFASLAEREVAVLAFVGSALLSADSSNQRLLAVDQAARAGDCFRNPTDNLDVRFRQYGGPAFGVSKGSALPAQAAG